LNYSYPQSNKNAGQIMQKGILKKWDDGKGFGFIRPAEGEEDIFFHISALQQPERRPMVGDVVYFSVKLDSQGRKSAISVNIEGVKSIFVERQVRGQKAEKPYRRVPKDRVSYGVEKRGKRNSALFRTASACAFLAVGMALLHSYRQVSSSPLQAEAQLPGSFSTGETLPLKESGFECAGKSRCTEMTSCEEAVFYLNHCPGTLTDGDGDGLPCEDQWCGHRRDW
jgi:cold shock CspA family protein